MTWNLDPILGLHRPLPDESIKFDAIFRHAKAHPSSEVGTVLVPAFLNPLFIWYQVGSEATRLGLWWGQNLRLSSGFLGPSSCVGRLNRMIPRA